MHPFNFFIGSFGTSWKEQTLDMRLNEMRGTAECGGN